MLMLVRERRLDKARASLAEFSVPCLDQTSCCQDAVGLQGTDRQKVAFEHQEGEMPVAI